VPNFSGKKNSPLLSQRRRLRFRAVLIKPHPEGPLPPPAVCYHPILPYDLSAPSKFCSGKTPLNALWRKKAFSLTGFEGRKFAKNTPFSRVAAHSIFCSSEKHESLFFRFFYPFLRFFVFFFIITILLTKSRPKIVYDSYSLGLLLFLQAPFVTPLVVLLFSRQSLRICNQIRYTFFNFFFYLWVKCEFLSFCYKTL